MILSVLNVLNRRMTRSFALCGPKTSSTSSDQAVFVDQATDTRLFSDAVLLKIDGSGSGFSGAAPSSDR